jgi:hypothetical protein
MPLNTNNILRWTGALTKLESEFTLGSPTATMYATDDYVTFDILSGTSSALILDTYSLDIVRFNGVSSSEVIQSRPYYWNGVDEFTFYRPEVLTGTVIYIYFTIKDTGGNISDEMLAQITLSAISTTWVVYPPSAMCTLDSFGQNNGLLFCSQLKLINSSTLADISPLTLKDNLISDPDYVPAIVDTITCPVPTGGVYAPLIIGNFSNNPANSPTAQITITGITIACSSCGSGGTPLLQSFSCNIPSGKTQQFLIAAIAWDTGLTISYTVDGDMTSVTYPVLWRSQTNGVLDNYPSGSPHQVDNSGIYGNFAITLTYPNGLVIFCQ